VSKSARIQTGGGKGLKISIQGKDTTHPGLLVDAVMKGGPSDGILTAGDRIVKIGGVDIASMENRGAMAVLGKAVKAKPSFLELTVNRKQAPPLPRPRPRPSNSAAATASTASATAVTATTATIITTTTATFSKTRSKGQMLLDGLIKGVGTTVAIPAAPPVFSSPSLNPPSFLAMASSPAHNTRSRANTSTDTLTQQALFATEPTTAPNLAQLSAATGQSIVQQRRARTPPPVVPRKNKLGGKQPSLIQQQQQQQQQQDAKPNANSSPMSIVTRKRKALNQSSRASSAGGGGGGSGNVSYTGLKNVLARAHRKNKLLDALLTKPKVSNFGSGAGVVGGNVVSRPAPPYPTSDYTMLRASVEPTNLSAINDASGRWSRCSSTDMTRACNAQELSIFLGKNLTTLGVRLVGTRSQASGDGGIFIGRKKSVGPENRELLSVGDQVLKVNGCDITAMSNRAAIETIGKTVKEADAITLTVMRYADQSAACEAADMSILRSSTPLEAAAAAAPAPAQGIAPLAEVGWV